MALKGKASTYGNYPDRKRGGYRYRDPGDNNRPAQAGASNNDPGIAVYNRRTLGGYWEVTSPNGKKAVIRQTDLGPAPWTGKKIDLNAVAARDVFGLPYGNKFPTGEGTWKAKYLGKKPPKGVKPGRVDQGGIAKQRAAKAPKTSRAAVPVAAPVQSVGLDVSQVQPSGAELPALSRPAVAPVSAPASPAHSARRFLRSATGQTELGSSWSPPVADTGLADRLASLRAETEARPWQGPAQPAAEPGTVSPVSEVPMPKQQKAAAAEPRLPGGSKRSVKLPGGVVSYGKGWGGAQGVAELARKTAKDFGAPIVSEKRNSNIGAGTSSDHHVVNKNSYALDIATSGAGLNRIASALKRRYGIKGNVIGTFNRHNVKVGDRNYSVQILSRVEGHF